jgi:hypothetical protein
MMSGGNWIAAFAVSVEVEDFLTHEVAQCAVKITTLQTMPGAGPNPFSRPAATINSIRSAADLGTVKFYALADSHPNEPHNRCRSEAAFGVNAETMGGDEEAGIGVGVGKYAGPVPIISVDESISAYVPARASTRARREAGNS